MRWHHQDQSGNTPKPLSYAQNQRELYASEIDVYCAGNRCCLFVPEVAYSSMGAKTQALSAAYAHQRHDGKKIF